MRTMCLAAIVLSLVALLPIGDAVAQATPEAFEAEMSKIDAAVKTGRWKRAISLLDALLTTHKGLGHAIARRDEIIEIDKQCRFRIRYPKPDPNDVVSGDLLTCNLSSGKIKIRYGRTNLKDFTGVKGLFRLHTARFAGPYTIQIKGKSYPNVLGGFLGGTPPSIWVCWDGEDGYVVSFGYEASGSYWAPAKIVSVKEKEAIAEKETTLARKGKPFKLKVKVGKTSIRSYYNNKSLLKVKKSSKLFGLWGYSGIKDFDEITVEGKAEPAWLQGRIDAALERKRKSYEACYRPKASLPAWLLQPTRTPRVARGAEGGKSALADRSEAPEFPGEEPGRAEQRRLDHASDMIERQSFRGCLAYLRRSGEGAIEESRRVWLMAQCHAGMGETEKGLEACTRLRKLAPDFTPGAALRAELLHENGQTAEALVELDALVKIRPDALEAHLLRFIILLGQERFDEARRALDAAARGLGPCKEVDALRKLLVKSTRGPNWSRTYQHKSAHYIVYSDIDRRVCTDAAKILEDAYRLYNIHLKRAGGDRRRFRVYMFSGQAGFMAHCRDALGASPVNAAGVYSPTLRQLLIWNLPDRGAMMRTVRHEGFHQYFHRVLNDPPTWLNEGLAEYYEIADYRNGRWHTGGIRADHVRALVALEEKGGLYPIYELTGMAARRFYSRSEQTYALAWAFVHFLLHGPKKYRHLVDLAFKGGKNGEPGDRAIQKALGKLDHEAMDDEFRAYLKKLAGKL